MTWKFSNPVFSRLAVSASQNWMKAFDSENVHLTKGFISHINHVYIDLWLAVISSRVTRSVCYATTTTILLLLPLVFCCCRSYINDISLALYRISGNSSVDIYASQTLRALVSDVISDMTSSCRHHSSSTSAAEAGHVTQQSHDGSTEIPQQIACTATIHEYV